MENKYSKKTVERIIFKDFGFDDSHLFWVAQGLPLIENGDNCLFTYADLNELHENIRNAILEQCIEF